MKVTFANYNRVAFELIIEKLKLKFYVEYLSNNCDVVNGDRKRGIVEDNVNQNIRQKYYARAKIISLWMRFL